MVHEGFRTRRADCGWKSLVWVGDRVLKRGVCVKEPAMAAVSGVVVVAEVAEGGSQSLWSAGFGVGDIVVEVVVGM